VVQVAAQLAVIAVVLALRMRQIDGRISPDGQYYLNMSIGRPTPKPYCFRVFVPFVSRMLRFLPMEPHWTMRCVVFAGMIALLASSYLLTLSLGGSTWAAFAVVMVLIMTESLVGSWIMFPWLTDSWAMAFAVAASLSSLPLAALLLLLSALSKETGYALGAAFILLRDPSHWWVAVPGAIALILARLTIKPSPPDQEWLKNPIAYSQASKRREWFSYSKNLGHMKLTPFAAAALLPGTVFAVPAAAVAVIAWAQTLIAVDHARLISMALPFVVPMVAVVADDWMLAVWVLSSLFWPSTDMEYA